MKINIKTKENAINLRKHGFTYSEIIAQIPIAKSTLSEWLHDVGLSKNQKRRITEKKIASALRGSRKRHEQRLALIQKISEETSNDIKKLGGRDLWLFGVILYWAEGSKQKDHNVSQRVSFSNSDPRMIRLFVLWLKKIIKITDDEIGLELYIHTSSNAEKILKYWSKELACDEARFSVYFKQHKIKRSYRKNIGESYNGLVRVQVRRSTELNRKISGWIDAICNYWKI
jgi:hypothetical protein